MFTISNLSVSYGRKSVLRNLSLEIPEQSITGIAGYNGAGKTTLLNAMYGLFRCAKDCLKHNWTPVTMKEIAFLEAETYFYSGITGRDWLSFFMRKNRKFDYEKWSSLFSLPLDEAVADYSLGMKKKLALLAVLSLDRKFIILDEPFNSLDLESVTMLEIILKRLAEKGRTIIVTSHMIEVLMSCCDSICILRDGSITGRYPKEQFGSLSDSIREEVSARCGGILDF